VERACDLLPQARIAGSLGCVALPKEAAGPLGSDMRAAASDGDATRGGPAEGGGWSWALDLSCVKYQETPSGTHGHTVLTPPR
jgi:hypothetical protein